MFLNPVTKYYYYRNTYNIAIKWRNWVRCLFIAPWCQSERQNRKEKKKIERYKGRFYKKLALKSWGRTAVPTLSQQYLELAIQLVHYIFVGLWLLEAQVTLCHAPAVVHPGTLILGITQGFFHVLPSHLWSLGYTSEVEEGALGSCLLCLILILVKSSDM